MLLRFKLFAVTLLALVAFGAADVVGHWKFDETSGTTAADSSPGGNGGTLTGDATFAPGLAGNCIQVSSGGNGLVRMGNILPLTNTSFTISAWIKSSATNHRIPVSKHTAGHVNGYYLAFNSEAGYGTLNKAYFYGSVGATGEPISSADVNTNTWKHIVGVYEQGVAARIYVDGQFEASKGPGFITTNTSELCVGGLFIPATGYTNYFDGQVDDVQIYNRALSAWEVAYLFNNPGKESWQATGQVKQDGVGVPGVTVNAKQNGVTKGTGISDSLGNYVIAGLEQGTYTLEPAHNDKYFFPSTKEVTLAPDAATQNFTAANIGPFSIVFEHPVVYSDQSRRGILGLNVPTPINRSVTMSDNSFKLTSPILVTVPAGLRTKDFFVYGVSVAADVLVTVTATAQGLTATGQITVRQKPALTGITLANSVKGGRGISGFVSIDKPAIAAMALQITSSNTNLAIVSPSNTAMPNGAVNKSFYCKTFAVATTQNVTITANFYGSTATKQLSITP